MISHNDIRQSVTDTDEDLYSNAEQTAEQTDDDSSSSNESSSSDSDDVDADSSVELSDTENLNDTTENLNDTNDDHAPPDLNNDANIQLNYSFYQEAFGQGDTNTVADLVQHDTNIQLNYSFYQEAFDLAFGQGDTNTVADLVQYVDATIPLGGPQDPIKFQPLHRAVEDDNLPMVKALLDNNPHYLNLLEQEDAFGRTPLWLAIYNHREIALYLLKKGACSNKIVAPESEYGIELLHKAATVGDLKLTRALVKNLIRHIQLESYQLALSIVDNTKTDSNPDLDSLNNQCDQISKQKISSLLNLKNANGATPLLLAVQANHTQIVTYLLNNGANPNTHQADGTAALNVASTYKNLKIALALIQAGADIRPSATLPYLLDVLDLAFDNGDAKVVALIIQQVNIDNRQIWDYLYDAIKVGHLEMVEALVENNPNFKSRLLSNFFPKVDTVSKTPLMLAAERGHANVVTYLLSKNVDLNAENREFSTALHLAFRGGHDEVVALLAKKGVDIIQSVYPYKYGSLLFLREAATNGNLKMVKALIDDHPKFKGQALSRLLEHTEAVLNYKTILMLAAERGHADVVDYLLQKGANPNTVMNRESRFFTSKTAVHLAFKHGHHQVVALLVQKGVDITQPADPDDPHSLSLLQQAAKDKNPAMLKALCNGQEICISMPRDKEAVNKTPSLQQHLNIDITLPASQSSISSPQQETSTAFNTTPTAVLTVNSPRKNKPAKATKEQKERFLREKETKLSFLRKEYERIRASLNLFMDKEKTQDKLNAILTAIKAINKLTDEDDLDKLQTNRDELKRIENTLLTNEHFTQSRLLVFSPNNSASTAKKHLETFKNQPYKKK